jgi:hypothetical protein
LLINKEIKGTGSNCSKGLYKINIYTKYLTGF